MVRINLDARRVEWLLVASLMAFYGLQVELIFHIGSAVALLGQVGPVWCDKRLKLQRPSCFLV